MAQKLTNKEFDLKVKAMRETNRRMKILHEIREERELYSVKSRKKKAKTSTRFVIASIFSIVIYTIIVLAIQAFVGTEVSATLTERWYTFWTIEIGALTGIKIVNVIKGENDKTDNGDAVG